MEYVRRAVDEALDELLLQLPAILLDGPKAVGKTTTATQRARTTKKLYLQQDLDRAALSPNWLVEGQKPILLDEWQKFPQSWELVRESVDSDYSGGQFLLTGSLPDSGTHSGAGRITSLRMRPLGFSERGLGRPSVSIAALLAGQCEVSGKTTFSGEQYADEVARSGFFSIRNKSGNARMVALDGYLERIIDTDVREAGLNVRRPASLAAWLRAYAAATATTASWETIRDAATGVGDSAPTKATTLPYRDALTRLRILDELPAWIPSRNHFTRVGSASKHYLADPALALRLLGMSTEQLTDTTGFRQTAFDKPLFGRMFEALAALTVRGLAEAKFAKVMHFRDAKGFHEVDLIVQRTDGKILAIETKLSETVTPQDFKHLHWLSEQIGNELVGKVLIYAGNDAYTAQGVSVVPLALLGQ